MLSHMYYHVFLQQNIHLHAIVMEFYKDTVQQILEYNAFNFVGQYLLVFSMTKYNKYTSGSLCNSIRLTYHGYPYGQKSAWQKPICKRCTKRQLNSLSARWVQGGGSNLVYLSNGKLPFSKVSFPSHLFLAPGIKKRQFFMSLLSKHVKGGYVVV